MLRTVAALAATVLVSAVPACSTVITGVAQPDPRRPGLERTEDSYGITAGFTDAPVQLELFTEPQCEHCAEFQADFGEDIKRTIESGQLAVTYRPVTFLDDEYEIDYSAMAANALFLTVSPATSAATFQAFVEDLWANQDLSWEDYSSSDFADLARDSGIADALVEKIDAAEPAVDPGEMNEANLDSLAAVSGGRVGTPTVYDLKNKEVVDLSDSAWLDNLIKSA